MYFNVLVILLYFNIVNSIPDSDELYDIYENDLRTIENSESVSEQSSKDSFYSMLNSGSVTDLLIWSTLCRKVIQHMREHNDKYKYIYVNYIDFRLMEYEEKCPTVDVWVPRMNKRVQQRACRCFDRTATVPLHSSEQSLWYLWKLSFYATTRENEIMVFEYDHINRYHILVGILKEISYNSESFYSLVAQNHLVFLIAVPTSSTQKYYLRQKLETFIQNVNLDRIIDNIIFQLAPSNFTKLCEAIFNTRIYGNDVIIDTNKRYREKKTKIRAIFQVPHVQENAEYIVCSRECPGYDPRMLRRISKFKMAAGPELDSLIVLKETEFVSGVTNVPLYEIIELVENVTLDYILLYARNLY